MNRRITLPASRRSASPGRGPATALVCAGLLLGGLAPSSAPADPVDIGAEIPGPAAEGPVDHLGDDWIRSEVHGSETLEADQLANSDRQRALVDAIARHQLGDQLDQTVGDLRIIQRILDEKRLGANPDDTVQALGVVLGDVLVAQAGYHWIRFEDDRGRSRALRSRNGKAVAFPVTAIERVRNLDLRPDVAGIYAELAAMGGAPTSP